MDELYEDSLPSDEEQRKIKISDDKIKEKMATLSSRNKLLLYGSDKVIQAYLSFVEHIDEQTKAKNENRQIEDRMEILWNEILVAMREDIYGENSIDRQKINKYFNTFNRF
jgi:vacuolar-type H+-ATPase subunit B/Vma2